MHYVYGLRALFIGARWTIQFALFTVSDILAELLELSPTDPHSTAVGAPRGTPTPPQRTCGTHTARHQHKRGRVGVWGCHRHPHLSGPQRCRTPRY